MSSNRNYSLPFADLTPAAAKTLVGVTGAGVLQPEVYEVHWGSSAAPVAQSASFGINRNSTAGTCTAATPAPMNPSTIAAVCTAGTNYTAEPTIGVLLVTLPLNQQATYRWVVVPGLGLGCYGTLTANNGVGFRSITINTAYLVSGAMMFQE